MLYEAYLLKLTHGTLQNVIDANPEESALSVYDFLHSDDSLRGTIVSIGVPILSPDGRSIIRGPRINIPESIYDIVNVDAEQLDRWAKKGWVDLRPANIRRWQERFVRMKEAQHMLSTEGTASISRSTYLHGTIEIGAVVAWIFNNELEGSRLK